MFHFQNMAAQHEALTKDYNQLEIDFNELLKDKERLEQDLLNQAGSTSPTPKHRLPSHTVETELWLEERDLLVAERDQLELTIKELATENALLEKKLELAQRKILESESGGVEKAPGSFPRTNQGQSHLERMLEEVTRENGELEEELAHAQDQIADLEARLESSQREEDEGEDIEALRASVTQLELTVAELSRENVQLENDLLNSREQLEAAREALDSKWVLEGTANSTREETIEKLKKQNGALVEQASALQKEIADLKQNVNMQSKPGKTLDINIRENHLLEAIAQLQNEKGKLEQELQLLKAKHQTVILESRGRSATVTESHQFDEEKKYQMEEVQSLRAQLDKLHLHMAVSFLL